MLTRPAPPLRAHAAKNSPWVQTLTGAAVDLVRPDPETVDFVNDIAPTLAVLPRFNGAARDWYVSDHLVLGCAPLRSRFPGNRQIVAQWLLHDAHEAYIGDIITPVAKALEAHADAEFRGKGGYEPGIYVKAAIASLKKTLDRAIHEAAGVPLPDIESAAAIRHHDLAMMITERNHLMAASPRSWGAADNIPPLRVAGRMKSFGKTPELRAQMYLTALGTYCPQALRRVFSATSHVE